MYLRKPCDVLIVRALGVEHARKTGYWHSWYHANVLAGGDDPAARVRAYWKGLGLIDAIVLPDTETATDVALGYSGAWAETVRGMAACIALGEDPNGDGGSRVFDAHPQPQPAPSGSGVTLDSLVQS